MRLSVIFAKNIGIPPCFQILKKTFLSIFNKFFVFFNIFLMISLFFIFI